MIKKAVETMNSRERVRRTFAFEKTDRVTIGYLAHDVAHERVCRLMGLDKNDMLTFLKALGVDYVGAKPRYIGKQLFPEIPNRYVNPEIGAVKKFVENEYGGCWDYCDYPLLNADDEEIYNYPAPDPDDYDYEELSRYIDMVLEMGFSVHVGDTGTGDILNTNGVLLGFENSLVNLAMEHEPTLHMTDKRLNSQLGVLERILEKNKGKIDFMWLGEDLGTQRGPTIGMDMYKRVLAPRHQKFIDLAKAYNIPTQIHTCGSSSWVYEEFIKMGIKGVDSLQPEAENMSPRYLVEHFGGRLNFRGCISTAGPLAFGTPAEVEEVCKETLEIMMECRGYHFAPTHRIQINTPPENIIALYQAAHKYGCY